MYKILTLSILLSGCATWSEGSYKLALVQGCHAACAQNGKGKCESVFDAVEVTVGGRGASMSRTMYLGTAKYVCEADVRAQMLQQQLENQEPMQKASND